MAKDGSGYQLACPIFSRMPTDGSSPACRHEAEAASAAPFHTFAMNFAGPLPEMGSGNKYVLFAVELLSGCPIVRATISQYSDVSVRFFQREIGEQFRSPKTVLTDGGPACIATSWRTALSRAGRSPKAVAPYSSQPSGIVERM